MPTAISWAESAAMMNATVRSFPRTINRVRFRFQCFTSRCILQLVKNRNGEKMKIAVATIDGISLSQHFGQSKGFVVFDVQGLTVQNREFRTNDDTPHNQGVCNHEAGKSQGAHGHKSIFELLSDCGIVLCGGMGAGAAQSMLANGIKPVMMPGARSTDDAVADYISGNIPATQPGFCNCQH